MAGNGDMFAGQAEQYADASGPNPDDNTVGAAVPKIYGTDDTTDDNGLLAAVSKSAKDFKITTGTEKYTNSPTYFAQHMTQLGKFFGAGVGSGNEYTNRIQAPARSKATQATNPEDFYAQWYNRMRNFSQAEEVASRGQGQIRGR